MTNEDVQVVGAIQQALAAEDAKLALRRRQAELVERIMRMKTEVSEHLAQLLAPDTAGAGLINDGAREELLAVAAKLDEAGDRFNLAREWILEGLQAGGLNSP